MIDSIKFKNNGKSKVLPLLKITDKTLINFSKNNHFPSLVLEHCNITVTGIVHYMEVIYMCFI